MKNSVIFIIAFYLALSNVYAQETNNSKIYVISDLDKIIFETKHIDVKTLSKNIINTISNAPETTENNLDTLVLKLYTILELENPAIEPDTLLFFLENVRTYETVYELYNKLNKEVLAVEEEMSDRAMHTKVTYLGGLKRNLKVVEGHMEHILEYNYSQYKNINISDQLIKGVYIEVDNDLFAFTNKDMNYTGGGRFEITTDYLKMRLLRLANKEKILSYQGVFIGFKAYTPFIRDTSIFKTTTSFDVNDRPFASYTYIGRSKYRIHSSGHLRMRSDFKIGIIGGNVGNVIQSIIHRDQFVSSLKPYGWDSQIAKGGRFAWNIDHYFDLMLFSGKGDIFNLNRTKPTWLNIPLMFDAHIGNELTALGAGIGFSNLNFKDRSGNEDIKLPESKSLRFIISANAKYRYVIHNSMLEGIGILETFPDDDDPLAPKDLYRLEADEVVRHLFLAELFLGFRTMNTTIYWKLTMNTKEYNKPKAKDIYQWGRFGVNFLF
jgi:hypothetical protein